jgi:hypothetical protein
MLPSERMAIRGVLLIVSAFGSRDCQPFNLAAGYLLKLRLPAFARLGNEEKDQTIPSLA